MNDNTICEWFIQTSAGRFPLGAMNESDIRSLIERHAAIPMVGRRGARRQIENVQRYWQKIVVNDDQVVLTYEARINGERRFNRFVRVFGRPCDNEDLAWCVKDAMDRADQFRNAFDATEQQDRDDHAAYSGRFGL